MEIGRYNTSMIGNTSKGITMLSENDFVRATYNGKTRYGHIVNIRKIGERTLLTIQGVVDMGKDDEGWPMMETVYRSLYLDKCDKVEKLDPMEVC